MTKDQELLLALRERNEARAEVERLRAALKAWLDADDASGIVRDVAERQREACARAVLADYVNGELTPASVTRACRIIQQTRLVTEGEP